MSKQELEVIIATDCGSTTTKAILIEKKDGVYRQTFRGEAPTTVEAPFEDVTKGVLNAITEVEELSGRKLLDGAEIVKIFGEEILVKARIMRMNGFSSHADRNMLLDWLRKVNADFIFINHGEDSVADYFASTAQSELGTPAVAPYSGDVYDLVEGVCVEKAAIKRTESKKNLANKRAKTVYERLIGAGFRLQKLIESVKGMSNKDIAKLTSQINNLCEKWEN